MLKLFVCVLAAMLIGVLPAAAQESQAPTGSELAEPYNPFESESGTTQTPVTPAPEPEEPDLFEVPRPSVLSGEETPAEEEPAPTMLEPNAGVQPLDIPQSPAVTPPPDLQIDQSMFQGSPVDIPEREDVVPIPETMREQVPGATN